MVPFDQSDLDRFRDIIARRLGLQVENGKNELLADVLRQRLTAHDSSNAASYLTTLASGVDDADELGALAGHLTVSETYFFRGWEQFQVLTNVALPERIRRRAGLRTLRVLSAGCASGEEAYSVAILLRKSFPELNSWSIEISGLDLNPAVLSKARKARYHPWSLRETPVGLRDQYFRLDRTEFALDKTICSVVNFKEQNLVSRRFEDADPFDIIFCRHVMMYLTPEAAQSLIARLTDALAPAGFLFLGCAETLRGLSHRFHLRHSHNAFYYQKREEGEQTSAAGIEDRSTALPLLSNGAELPWVNEVRRAGERIDRLSRESIGRLEPPDAGVTPSSRRRCTGIGLGAALELLGQERFQEALDVLHGSPPEANADPDAQLLHASLLVNCGDLETAERVCRQIFAADDLNAGAHFLMALCREHTGDTNGAIEHDRTAIYLDRGFAMPHLHLGRLAKRSADLITARRELAQAKSLLLREDPLHILLFGGGFSREALVAFCLTELRACGGLA